MSPTRRKAARRPRPKARGPRPKAKTRKPAAKRKAAKRRARPKARRAAPKPRRAVTKPPRVAPRPPALESMAAAPESAVLEVVEVRDSYKVTRSEHVFVSVDVDAAQLGEVSLFIDQTKIGDFTAPVASRDLGLGGDILRKLLIVEAIVSDVMTRTNALRIRVTLKGGPAAKTVPGSADNDQSGGSAKFRIFVLFLE